MDWLPSPPIFINRVTGEIYVLAPKYNCSALIQPNLFKKTGYLPQQIVTGKMHVFFRVIDYPLSVIK